jgi:hypothetical protein
MSFKLYITHVPILTDLRVLLAPFGAVRDSRMINISPSEGGTKSALVEMDSEEAGTAAIAALDGRMNAGQVLHVCRATARHETDADHTSLFGPMNMTPDAPPGDPHPPHVALPRRISHAWFSIEMASRYGSELVQRLGGATVNVTRISEQKDEIGSFHSDEKYLGEVMRREDGGCVRESERARGCTG